MPSNTDLRASSEKLKIQIQLGAVEAFKILAPEFGIDRARDAVISALISALAEQSEGFRVSPDNVVESYREQVYLLRDPRIF